MLQLMLKMTAFNLLQVNKMFSISYLMMPLEENENMNFLKLNFKAQKVLKCKLHRNPVKLSTEKL
jgi:hypothetical protein